MLRRPVELSREKNVVLVFAGPSRNSNIWRCLPQINHLLDLGHSPRFDQLEAPS